MKLHKHQEALLDLVKAQRGDLRSMTLRDIAEEIGLNKDRAQVVAHHLHQLELKGLVRRLSPGERLFSVPKERVQEVVYINLYRATAQCGPNGLLGDDMVADKIPLSSRAFGITNPEHYFLIKSRGDSMLPLIHSGDLVLAHKQEDVESNQVAVVIHDGMPKIKKVIKANGSLFLSSLNSKQYGDQEVVEADSGFRICGRVKGVLRTAA